MSLRECTDAIVKALRVGDAPGAEPSAYDWGQALKRSNFPATHSVVHVSERVPEVRRLDDTTEARAYRALVKCYAREFNDLVAYLEQVRAALLWQQIDLDGGRWFAPSPSTDPDPIDRENGWFAAVREYVFTV